MKIRTTIYDILASEFQRAGMNEFFDCATNTIDLTGKHLGFMFLLQDYTNPTIIKLSGEVLFGSVKLENEAFDNYFKRMYVNKFLDREIKFQTLDVFRSKNISYLLTQKQFLDEYFKNLDKYMSAGIETENTGKSKYRSAFQDLPQSQVNLMLDSDVMYTASNNTATNQSNEGNSGVTNYDIDTLLKFRYVLENVLLDFDRKLFSQIW